MLCHYKDKFKGNRKTGGPRPRPYKGKFQGGADRLPYGSGGKRQAMPTKC
jgi:hypothetical protein